FSWTYVLRSSRLFIFRGSRPLRQMRKGRRGRRDEIHAACLPIDRIEMFYTQLEVARTSAQYRPPEVLLLHRWVRPTTRARSRYGPASTSLVVRPPGSGSCENLE